MTRVRLSTETGNLIHFRHPHRLGYLVFVLSLLLVSISLIVPSVVPSLQIWAMAGFLGTFGLVFWSYRLDVQFLPNHHEYLVRKGFWPFLKIHQGSYDELIGVVLTKSGSRYVASFAFTSIDKPIAYSVSSNEADVRSQFDRFAKHLRTKAFDKTDPEKIIEFNWNQLGEALDDHSQITQNLPEIDFDCPPKGIRVEHGRKGFRIEVHSRGIRFKFLSMLFGGLFLSSSAGIGYALLSPEVFANLLGLFLVGFVVGILCIVAGVSGVFGKERIMHYQGKIHTDFALMNLPFWSKSIPIGRIEEIIVRSKSKRRSPRANGKKLSASDKGEDPPERSLELFIDADFQQCVFGQGQDRTSLEWIRSALIQKLYQDEKAA